LKEEPQDSARELPFATGDQIQLTIDDLAFGGEGVGHHEGVAVFVPFVMAGERVDVEITETKKSFARGRLVRIVEASSERIAPTCPHFTACGGCQYQHLPYPLQLETKRKQLVDIFERIGGFNTPPINPVCGSPANYGYRNRILVRTQYSKITKRMSVGFLRHDNRLVVDVEHCHIAEPALNEQLQTVRIDPPTKNGIKFNLRVMPEDWELPPDSFFQVNYHLLPEMVATVRRYLESAGAKYLYDIYCGAGFFCLSAADLVDEYIGVEIDKKAIQAAKKNATDRGHTNGEFIASPAEDAIPRLISRFEGDQSTVILDPPRRGCAPSLLDTLKQHRPLQVIYISCHPATLCRDLKELCTEGGYSLESVTPLDMFPQTKHVECICDLRRKE
jgi:tRNA/tmRNA/rRNA uracil-C5-methylase (TrmA/RlmC/RlmD family)